jgi:DNA-binding NarL/FixJ family response regulator
VLPLSAGEIAEEGRSFRRIAEYTVQIHLGCIMRKMEVDSFATLVKFAGKLKLEPTSASSMKP